MAKRGKKQATPSVTAAEAAGPPVAAPPPVFFGAREIIVLVGACIAAVLLAVFFVRALPDAVEKERVARVNKIHALCDDSLRGEPQTPLGPLPVDAPDFKLKDYAGREVSLSSLRGRAVLVNFWATWCPTCVVEMPSMEQLVGEMHGKPWTLLAVSVDEEWGAVRKFFKGGTQLTVLLDAEKKVPAQYGTEKFPETFVVDKDGKILYYVVSDRDWTSPDVKACMDALSE